MARFTKKGDLPATVKLFGGFFLFPITWALWCAAAGVVWGTPGALGAAVLAPLSSWFAMRFHERYERFFEDVAAWLRLRTRRSETAALRADRDDLRRQVDHLRHLDE